jgi:hypothetical protein
MLWIATGLGFFIAGMVVMLMLMETEESLTNERLESLERQMFEMYKHYKIDRYG